MAISTVSKEFFEQKYRADNDPWEFSSSSYERNRYAEILRILGQQTFRCAFEPGCSIGILTAQLATRCSRLFAMDISPTAVARARERCEAHPHVTIVEGALPAQMPIGIFDLIVFSEIGYYFERNVLADIRDQLIERLTQQGTLIAVHWLGESPDHVLTGDEVHDILRATNALTLTNSRRHDGFLLESWERA
jgi:SAM-dependent methyltransferase